MKVKVDGQEDFDVEVIGEKITVNGKEIAIDRRELSKDHSHIIFNHRSYTIAIVAADKTQKTCQIKVNGNLYDLKIEDRYDVLLKQLGMDTGSNNIIKEVKAPMPGLVLSIIAEEGAEIDKGDSLLVLEAMKMENIIKSPSKGTVRKITVHQGDKVEKNQILIELA